MAEMATPSKTVVQQVPKATSDKLLVKFSDVSVYDYGYSDQNSACESPSSSSHKKKKKKKKTGSNKAVKKAKTQQQQDDVSSASASAMVALRKPLNVGSSSNSNSKRKKSLGNRFRKTLGMSGSSALLIAQLRARSAFTAVGKAWNKTINRASNAILENHGRMQPRKLTNSNKTL